MLMPVSPGKAEAFSTIRLLLKINEEINILTGVSCHQDFYHFDKPTQVKAADFITHFVLSIPESHFTAKFSQQISGVNTAKAETQ